MQKPAKIVQNELLVSSVYRDTDYTNSIFQRKPVRNKLPGLYGQVHPGRMRQPKKNWARKKRMASWARQRQQITEAADGGARARTGADGAVVLNLRRGPGAYALLSRADRRGEEHIAKLSVNAMIGLWARSTEVVYSVRSSSSELDGAGADFSQAFAYEGGWASSTAWWPRPGASWTRRRGTTL